MSHNESKVGLSQAELKQVCQVKQKGIRLSGRETHIALLHLSLTSPFSLRLTSSTCSFPSQTLSDTATISTALPFCLTLSHHLAS